MALTACYTSQILFAQFQSKKSTCCKSTHDNYAWKRFLSIQMCLFVEHRPYNNSGYYICIWIVRHAKLGTDSMYIKNLHTIYMKGTKLTVTSSGFWIKSITVNCGKCRPNRSFWTIWIYIYILTMIESY